MKTRWVVSLSAAFVVLAAGIIVILAQPSQETLLIPNTGPSEVLPSSIEENPGSQHTRFQITDPVAIMNFADMARIAALQAPPMSIEAYTPAQRARYQITDPLEAENFSAPVNVEALPELVSDFTPAQRTRYQITDPLP